MIREFPEFIMRGNVVDLAIAVVIGAAFGAVITSFVVDMTPRAASRREMRRPDPSARPRNGLTGDQTSLYSPSTVSPSSSEAASPAPSAPSAPEAPSVPLPSPAEPVAS